MYAGVVDCQAGSGSVELRRYPSSHAFAQLQGSDNIIAFTTQRYNQQPLIIRCAPPVNQGSWLIQRVPAHVVSWIFLAALSLVGSCTACFAQSHASRMGIDLNRTM